MKAAGRTLRSRSDGPVGKNDDQTNLHLARLKLGIPSIIKPQAVRWWPRYA